MIGVEIDFGVGIHSKVGVHSKVGIHSRIGYIQMLGLRVCLKVGLGLGDQGLGHALHARLSFVVKSGANR